MADKYVDLKLDQSLIDTNFDGYKLSLDKIPVYKKAISPELDIVRLQENQYSYQHVKAFSMHNHLFADQWNKGTVYYINNKWQIIQVTYKEGERDGSHKEVLQIPISQKEGRYNISLHFPSDQWLVVADGTGNLYVVETGNRQANTKWRVSYTMEGAKPSALIHSCQYTSGGREMLECLQLRVDSEQLAEDTSKVPFNTVLEWTSFSAITDGSWMVERERRLEGKSCPDYAAIEPIGGAVIIASEKPFKMVYDSMTFMEEDLPTEQSEQDAGKAEAEAAQGPSYTWSQTEEEVNVDFTLPEGVTKPDIHFKVTKDTLEIGVKNGDMFLSGQLCGLIDVDCCTWTFQGNRRLCLTLPKKSGDTWPLVVVGNTRGEQVVDEAQAAAIHERLASLTSDQWNPNPESGDDKQAYNTQQLEECDSGPGDSFTMARFDGETRKISHKVNLSSNQWLFNATNDNDKSPCICLRHDVDGVIWQPFKPETNETIPWKHVATFNALGYVQASKTQKKFASCSPNFSFAVICDCTRHVYIYRQPTSVLSPLRNRKTGREVAAVSKQQLVSFDFMDDIMGLQVDNSCVYVLTKSAILLLHVDG